MYFQQDYTANLTALAIALAAHAYFSTRLAMLIDQIQVILAKEVPTFSAKRLDRIARWLPRCTFLLCGLLVMRIPLMALEVSWVNWLGGESFRSWFDMLTYVLFGGTLLGLIGVEALCLGMVLGTPKKSDRTLERRRYLRFCPIYEKTFCSITWSNQETSFSTKGHVLNISLCGLLVTELQGQHTPSNGLPVHVAVKRMVMGFCLREVISDVPATVQRVFNMGRTGCSLNFNDPQEITWHMRIRNL